LLDSVSIERVDAPGGTPLGPGGVADFRLLHAPLELPLADAAPAPAGVVRRSVLPPSTQASIAVSVDQSSNRTVTVNGTSFRVSLPLRVTGYTAVPSPPDHAEVVPTITVSALSRSASRTLPPVRVAALPLQVPTVLACFRHPDFLVAWGTNRPSRALLIVDQEMPANVASVLEILSGFARTVTALPAQTLDQQDWHLRLLLENTTHLTSLIAQQESTALAVGNIADIRRLDEWMNDEISAVILIGPPRTSATFFRDPGFSGGIFEIILSPNYYACSLPDLRATAVVPNGAAQLLGPYSTANDEVTSIQLQHK
jgi:hypothetical protein